MYRLCVPLMDNGRATDDLEKLALELRTAGTDTIFLVFDRVLDNDEMLQTKIKSFIATMEKLIEKLFLTLWVKHLCNLPGNLRRRSIRLTKTYGSVSVRTPHRTG